jgi:hypothetical protein
MNPRPHRCKSEFGFSLVETLVAMSLISTIVMGSLGMLTLAQRNLASGGKGLEVLARAQSGMEAFRTMPYRSMLTPDLKDDSGVKLTLEHNGTGQFVGRHTVHGVDFVWLVIPEGPDLSKSSVTTVRVSAEWSDSQAQRRKLSLGMVRANPVYGGAL